ncbi:MAG: DNA polymerase IV [bacterium]|nr:MAG: DNA polymerase IV [bacterium]
MIGPIAHVDMDAFFAAVEIRANPRLVGKPLLVGGGPNGRQVVTTASYPARAFGIRSGMSLREAQARCPEAIFLPVDPPRYLSASESLIRLFERFTPVVEPASIDEVFLDLSGIHGLIDGGGEVDLLHRHRGFQALSQDGHRG